MKRHRWIILLCLPLYFACTQATRQTAPAAPEGPKNYFPVADFIKSEIHEVDSLPLAIIKYSNLQNKQRDSAFIKPEEFNRLAQDFLPPLFTNGTFEKEYTEGSFMDETTHSVVFTYSTRNPGQEVQRIDVLANPVQGSRQIKSIYMEKINRDHDTLRVKKLTWEAHNHFQVVSSIQAPGQKATITQLKVQWGSPE